MGRGDYRQNKRIRTLEKKVHKMNMDHEVKYIDAVVTNGVPTTAGTLMLLNGSAPGDTQVTRDGSEIRATSVQIRISFFNTLAITVPFNMRIICFWDKQANGVAPTISGSPLGSVPALLNTTTIPIFTAPFQMENKERFKVLFDNYITINPYNATIQKGKMWSKFIKLNRIVEYGDDVATIAGINSNSLYLLYLAENATTGELDIGTRFNFIDI